VSAKLFELMITLQGPVSVLVPELQVFEIPDFFLVDNVSENKTCCGQKTLNGKWAKLLDRELHNLCTSLMKFNHSGYITLKRGNKTCIQNFCVHLNNS
jgi:hypothetical protein